ncbi:MAG: O-antigen ligase family protein [Alphaproteobacteria bacterium]|nr:O-antigen ligase family protein [Alphaproteobacteria bacterium]
MNVGAVRSPGSLAGGLPAHALALAIGVAVGIGTAVLAELGTKQIALVVAGVGLLAAALVSRRPLPVVIATWVVSLGYDRQYYSFEGLVGSAWGPRGLYWVPSDMLLLLAIVIWGYEYATSKPADRRWGAPLWPIFLPFALANLLSAIGAVEPMPALFDTIRLFKVGLMLWLLRRVLAPGIWNAAAIGLLAAVALQSLIGIAQAAAGTNQGIMALFGAPPAPVEEVYDESARISHRANGTTAHPNVYAPYLLMLLPAAWALALGSPAGWLRRIALAVAAIGLVGVVASQSRSPTALSVLTIGGLVVSMVAMRLLDIRHVLVGGALAGLVVGGLGLWQWERIERRVFGDLERSVDFRARYNEAAIDIWAESPVIGVGANNFGYRLGSYAADLADMNRENEDQYAKISVRTFAPVHNVYLLVLSESGALGLVSFVLLLGGALRVGVIAVRRATGPVRLVCLGLLWGVAAQCVQQIGDFSLWNDVNLQSFAVVLALLNAAPALAETRDAAA